jgi:hypothetical protein
VRLRAFALRRGEPRRRLGIWDLGFGICGPRWLPEITETAETDKTEMTA